MVARAHGTSHPARGAASRRRGAKLDKDGDISMGAIPASKGRIGKLRSTPTSAKDNTARAGRQGPRPGGLTSVAKKAILKHVNGANLDTSKVATHVRRPDVDLKVTGWDKSKIVGTPDRGIESLVTWLERRASSKLGSRKTNAQVYKTTVDGDILYITVPPNDVSAFLRINGFGWCGTNIHLRRRDDESATSSATADTKAMLRSVLEGRYNPETKLLDLSALHTDEILQAQHVFDSTSTTGKIFPAMMRVLELCFEPREEIHSAIESVSLANNDLSDLKLVTTLSETLPRLRNLDLSNNKFESLSALHSWRGRFRSLQQLILAGNPLVVKEPEYPAEILKWYRNLRTLNGVQVRTQEEVESGLKNPPLPFPIRSPLFQDEGGIAENFVRTFFTGYDTDRAKLTQLYYDNDSDFSFAVNVTAPHDPSITHPADNKDFEAYIKHSRNLKRITNLQTRYNRMSRGTAAVTELFASLPETAHPNLAAEAKKWLIEAHIQPGVPDPSGQSTNGVDGFLIVVHGEFQEPGLTPAAPPIRRSFDRTFIIGPGGPSGVRIINDLLVVRPYGSTQAFEPDNTQASAPTLEATQQQPPPNTTAAAPQLPAGLTIPVAEQMVAELQKQTAMTIEYSKDCLEQVGWDFDKALQVFGAVRATLPPAAFVQVV